MPVCRRDGRELLCLRLYSSFLRVSQGNGSIWESTPQEVPNRKAICGEVFTTARTIPHDGLLLKIHPLPVFQSRPGLSSYWAFSAILCVDHTVVEDLFVEWGGHESRQPNPGWKFDDIFPVPQQTVSVGFFAYPLDQTGRKIFQPRLISVLVVRLIDNSSGGTGFRPSKDKSYPSQPEHLRGHPFFGDYHPTPKVPSTTSYSSIGHLPSTSEKSLARSSGSRDESYSRHKREASPTSLSFDSRESKRRTATSSSILLSRLGEYETESALIEREEAELRLLEEELEITERRVENLKEQIKLLQSDI